MSNYFGHECSHCGETFLKVSLLKVHKVEHEESWHECPECRECFDNKEALDDHKWCHLRSYPCATCGEVLRTHKEFNMHKKEHILVWYKCSECNLLFDSLKGVTCHRGTHRKSVRETKRVRR